MPFKKSDYMDMSAPQVSESKVAGAAIYREQRPDADWGS